MKSDEEIVKEEILSSLLRLGKDRLTVEQAEIIVSKLKIDTNNSFLMHKGPNWFAKEILKKISTQ